MNTLSISLILLGLFFVVDLKPLNDFTKWGHNIVKRSDGSSSRGNSSLLCSGSNCNTTLNATSFVNVTLVQMNLTDLCQQNLTLRCNGSLVNLTMQCNNVTIEKSLLHCVSETSNVTIHNANMTTTLAVNSSKSVNSTTTKITSANNTANSTVVNNTATTIVPSTSKVQNTSTLADSRVNQTNVPSTSSAPVTSTVSSGTQKATTTVSPTTTRSTTTKATATQSTTTQFTTAQSTMTQSTTTPKPTTQSAAAKSTMQSTSQTTTRATTTLIPTPASSESPITTVKSTERPSTKQATTIKPADVHTKNEISASVEASTGESGKTVSTTSEYPHPVSTMESPYNSEKNIKFFYVNVLIPVGIGVCGALLIAFSVVLFKCCRRNKVKKVRYFGKPKGYSRNNMDHMNLLANSSDEE